MSNGKDIRAYGKTDLDMSSGDAWIEELAHRLNVNFHVKWWKNEGVKVFEKQFDYNYDHTYSLLPEISGHTGDIYMHYVPSADLHYMELYPSGFFSIGATYTDTWNAFLEDLELHPASLCIKEAYAKVRQQLYSFCLTMGSTEIAILSDYDFNVVNDLELGRSVQYPVHSVSDFIEHLKNTEHLEVFDFVSILQPRARFRFSNHSDINLAFHDDFRDLKH